mgnify:CR=1 FL=1
MLPGAVPAVRRDDNTVLYFADEGLWPTLSLLDVRKDPASRQVIWNSEDTGLVAGLPAALAPSPTLPSKGWPAKEAPAIRKARSPSAGSPAPASA